MFFKQFKPNWKTQPEQVQANKEYIAQLKKENFTIYNTQLEMTEDNTGIDLSQTDINPERVDNALLLSKNGLLFKIVSYSAEYGEVYLKYYTKLTAGPQGEKGDGFNFMGEWVSNNEYFKDDVVTYAEPNGTVSSYVLITETLTGSTTPPNIDAINWAIFAKGVLGSALPINLTGVSAGTLTAEQLASLRENKGNYIVLNNEIYILQDEQTASGYLVYSHVGHDSTNNFYVKCITITISTLGWVLSVEELTKDFWSGSPENVWIELTLSGEANTSISILNEYVFANINSKNIEKLSDGLLIKKSGNYYINFNVSVIRTDVSLSSLYFLVQRNGYNILSGRTNLTGTDINNYIGNSTIISLNEGDKIQFVYNRDNIGVTGKIYNVNFTIVEV